MTLSSTISAAVSGLGATSRAAKVVSSNLANALNENYGKRELNLSSASHVFNGGVRIDGIRRNVDPVLLADTRTAGSGFGLQSEKTDVLTKIERLVGNVDDTASLSGRMRQFESALAFAESNPGSDIRLQNVVVAAKELATQFSVAQSGIKEMREQADRAIAQGVSTVNSSLEEIKNLNQRIVAASINGHDISGYLDQRQELINTVSEFVPVKELPRQHGAVALMSPRGVVLVDQTALQIEFESSATIMPHMTVGSGDLGVLTVGDLTYDLASSSGGMSGGKFEGLFMKRDKLSEEAQASLDSLAYEVVSRFQSSVVDPSLAPGDTGLFTDAGSVGDPSNITGLAGRLELNENVDPGQGGAVWRIRDGVQSTVEGPTGNSDVLGGMLNALTTSQATSAPGLPGTGSLLDLASDVASSAASKALLSEQKLATSGAQYEKMQELLFAQGVDTDEEMQRLLMIETNYAANARVIQAVESMLDDLLRIGA